MKLGELCGRTLDLALKAGVDEASVLIKRVGEDMVRFSGNKVTVVKSVVNVEVLIYIARDGRRLLASTSDPVSYTHLTLPTKA